LSAAGSLCGGVDLGGTKIQAVVVGAEGEVQGEARHPTPSDGGPPDVAEAIERAVREAASAAGAEPGALAGIGVGSPGDANEGTGVVSAARNLPGWAGSFPLGEALSEALGTKVRIGNDVQVAVEGEHRLGAGRPYGSLIGVWWGTGVGGGIILEGRPWLGRGAAGEIGHTVVKRNGARCPCGRRGCLEAYAGRAAMEAKARREIAKGVETDLFAIMEKRGRDRLTSAVWEHALNERDPLAESLLRRAVRYLGTGIASAVNLLDVEAVVLGGGLGGRFGDRFLDHLGKEMEKHLFVDENPPDLLVAELGDLGGAIGASLLVRSEADAA
jgi:glucokinase